MRFSEFIVELDLPIPAQEPGDTPILRSEINQQLVQELEDVITSPNLGFQKIRKVLYRYGLDLPALYDINDDGDELALVDRQRDPPERLHDRGSEVVFLHDVLNGDDGAHGCADW